MELKYIYCTLPIAVAARQSRETVRLIAIFMTAPAC